MIAHSHPYWIVDSGVTEHIARNQVRFVEYHRIPKNGTSVQVHGIGTYKLELRGGYTLIAV